MVRKKVKLECSEMVWIQRLTCGKVDNGWRLVMSLHKTQLKALEEQAQLENTMAEMLTLMQVSTTTFSTLMNQAFQKLSPTMMVEIRWKLLRNIVWEKDYQKDTLSR